MTGQNFTSDSANSITVNTGSSTIDRANSHPQSSQEENRMPPPYEIAFGTLCEDWEKMHKTVVNTFITSLDLSNKNPQTGDDLFNEYCCNVGNVLREQGIKRRNVGLID